MVAFAAQYGLDQSWTLDALGNNLSAGTYNAANEETPTVGSSAYDAAGNMTTLKSGYTAKYDAWNHLTQVNDGATIIERNQYDGTGRRVQVFSSYSGSTPGTTVDNYHNGQQLIETRQNAAIQYQNVWSPRYIDAMILRDHYSGGIVTADRVLYLSDANYNVTGLLKYNGTSDWEVVERYTYKPYGEVTYRNASWTDVGSSANNNTTLFTGRLRDLLISIYDYRGRFYDDLLERLINRDPLTYKAGMNLYEYVGDHPTNATDPTGLMEFVATGVWRCNGYVKGDIIGESNIAHSFVKIDGTGYGFFEVDTKAIGTGKMRDDDLNIYPERDPSTISNGQCYSVCKEIKVNKACWDPAKFKKAMLAYIDDRTKNPGDYMVIKRDCHAFVASAISYALKNSKVDCPAWYCWLLE